MTPGNVEDLGGSGQGIAVVNGAELHLTDSSLVANEGTGIFGLQQAPITLSGSLIDGTSAIADTSALGLGVLLVQGAALQMSSSMVRRSAGTAVGFDGADGIVSGSFLFANEVGVGTTGGTVVVQASAAPVGLVQGKAFLYGTMLQGNTTSFSKSAISSQ
jgi:hypothetical protein